jgi:hypothetical protein
MTNSEFKFNLFKAALNKSVRVEPVETHSLQINNLQMASTGSARTEGLVQHCLNLIDASLNFCIVCSFEATQFLILTWTF